MLGLILSAMLIAGLNYNSNLGLAFAFLMASVAFVTMASLQTAFCSACRWMRTTESMHRGRAKASFEFMLRNDSNVDRRDVEIRCMDAAGMRSVPARSSESVSVAVPVPRRGVVRIDQFELRTRYPFGCFFSPGPTCKVR